MLARDGWGRVLILRVEISVSNHLCEGNHYNVQQHDGPQEVLRDAGKAGHERRDGGVLAEPHRGREGLLQERPADQVTRETR